VLGRGLEGWKEADLPIRSIDADADSAIAPRDPNALPSQSAHEHTFLPGLVENYANQRELPLKRELAILFVDIPDSTRAVVQKEPEEALAFVQRFMGIVTDAALAWCGDVKDYEGDGALLYFESVMEATQAAMAIRDSLAREDPVEGTKLHARLSLDVGSIVIGIIGTPMRRSVALIGPSINMAARLLKEIPPDGIIATAAVVERLRQEAPGLADRFTLLESRLVLKGFEDESVTAYSLRG